MNMGSMPPGKTSIPEASISSSAFTFKIFTNDLYFFAFNKNISDIISAAVMILPFLINTDMYSYVF